MINRKETELNGKPYFFETGRVAKQADGACWLQYGDTVVMATVVGAEEAADDAPFFPLSVDYREKAYAAGKIPGGYIKREGRPSDNEILSARLIDRSLRPLFDEEYMNEVQVMVSVLSADKENNPDILGISAASMALSLSGIPWAGPVAGIRVGRVNGEFIANPTHEQLLESDVNLIISATEESIIMVEGEAVEISEDIMLEGLSFGQETARTLIQLQQQMVSESAKPQREYAPAEIPPEIDQEIRETLSGEIKQLLSVTDKKERRSGLKELYETKTEALLEKYPEQESFINKSLYKLEKDLMRKMIIEERRRLDNRGEKDIRDITCEIGVLPRVHGTCIFTRGQTQALAAVTLGTKVDEQRMDELEGEFFKSYMLHYNFPPFSVGEIKWIRGPGRREIGHGNLAERSIKAVMPNESVFPYTVRIVSDVLESNGSSSMATVCAGSLALMDAGVPIKSAVAGIAMGLIKEGEKTVILTDILGDEDHLGDMDFKVAGTENGITGFQMDIKIKGLSQEIMAEALGRAREARLSILNVMNATLESPREEISKYAPRIITMKIATDSIGAVIGPGGKTIREIIERTGTTIDISDEGIITIAAVEPEACYAARDIITAMVAEPEVGTVYDGVVKGIKDFGAFVEILPGKEGLLHISQIENRRINRVEDVLSIGDRVEVKLIEVTPDGKLKLSRKALLDRS